MAALHLFKKHLKITYIELYLTDYWWMCSFEILFDAIWSGFSLF